MEKNSNIDLRNDYKKYLPIALGAGAVIISSQPASAQTAEPDPVGDITTMVTNLGTITGTVVGVVVAALTVRLAVKQVNRLMTKG